jgi:hypothetical protein
MTIGQARGALSIFWIAASAPLILLASIWTILSRSMSWELAWSWLGPLIGPQLSIIIAVWSATGTTAETKDVKSKSAFWGTILISGVYFIALYLVILLSPFSDNSLEELLKKSGWWLAFIQGFANIALGKFFIENQN